MSKKKGFLSGLLMCVIACLGNVSLLHDFPMLPFYSCCIFPVQVCQQFWKLSCYGCFEKCFNFLTIRKQLRSFFFQKFHPAATSETAKLSNKLIEHSSDALGEIPDKVFKPRMPAKFHQPVRAT